MYIFSVTDNIFQSLNITFQLKTVRMHVIRQQFHEYINSKIRYLVENPDYSLHHYGNHHRHVQTRCGKDTFLWD